MRFPQSLHAISCFPLLQSWLEISAKLHSKNCTNFVKKVKKKLSEDIPYSDLHKKLIIKSKKKWTTISDSSGHETLNFIMKTKSSWYFTRRSMPIVRNVLLQLYWLFLNSPQIYLAENCEIALANVLAKLRNWIQNYLH